MLETTHDARDAAYLRARYQYHRVIKKKYVRRRTIVVFEMAKSLRGQRGHYREVGKGRLKR